MCQKMAQGSKYNNNNFINKQLACIRKVTKLIYIKIGRKEVKTRALLH